jgi:hypothetical protein
MSYPSGGANAYICYGTNYGSGIPDKVEYAFTLDNGLNWSYGTAISDPGAQPSEPTVCRIGDNNLWLMAYRQNSANLLPIKFSLSTDMTTWSTPVDGPFLLGKNPPYLYYHEGFVYLFASMRNNPFYGNLSEIRYANKLIAGRALPMEIASSDFSNLANMSVIISADSLNGYFTLNKSPLTGHVFGSLNYNEKTDALVTGLVQRSKIAIVTTEKILHDYRGARRSFYTNESGNWRVTQHNAENYLEAFLSECVLTLGGGSYLTATIKFPVSFPLASDLEVVPVLKQYAPGSSVVASEHLGQMRVDQIVGNSCRIVLWRIAGTGSFVSDSSAKISVSVSGTYGVNNY